MMLILCCGNPLRGDDAAGVLVAENLRSRCIEAQVCTGDALPLMQLWSLHPDVLLIDAAVTGSPEGTIHFWDALQTQTPPQPSPSTHGFGVAVAVELARAMGKLPARLRVYGIEAKQFEAGTDPSPAVREAAKILASRIADECSVSQAS
jgi:hydrogenase maturation protease